VAESSRGALRSVLFVGGPLHAETLKIAEVAPLFFAVTPAIDMLRTENPNDRFPVVHHTYKIELFGIGDHLDGVPTVFVGRYMGPETY
jgi:hypothetical protein